MCKNSKKHVRNFFSTDLTKQQKNRQTEKQTNRQTDRPTGTGKAIPGSLREENE